ncbi:acylphosphatase [Candidatus Endoriftia persephonae]|jgi:acylphosphatase|uniref:Acylphosphatase n=2 Tax=Gammaproteobacteria TaxID=1236 RepID=G2FDQ3_9GAMM|nr:acylphosphatase [Candidatus Endoriftia persephone]EGW55108.1 acylphosphatase [endosymbiont of Tevnia jerichonana (vent Tica)]USF88285.1 acylphosphatase [Candidatus Endoriftia persephone]
MKTSVNEKGRVVCCRCYVSGRVQGVFFRATSRREAERLGLTGYAKNLLDGRVEVVACGDAAAVEALREWLHQGPPSAQVTAVVCETLFGEEYRGFSIG